MFDLERVYDFKNQSKYVSRILAFFKTIGFRSAAMCVNAYATRDDNGGDRPPTKRMYVRIGAATSARPLRGDSPKGVEMNAWCTEGNEYESMNYVYEVRDEIALVSIRHAGDSR